MRIFAKLAATEERAVGAIARLIFSHRRALLALFAVATLLLAWQSAQLRPDASFEKMIPARHPYVQTMLRHLADLGAAGTTIQVAVENTRGDIFDPAYLAVLRQVTDELFYIEGVDQNGLKSLWTPNVRWTEVTESGFEGGVVMPDTWDGSEESLAALRRNVLRSGQVGRLVADDFRSSIVEAPVFDRDPLSGEPLDYRAFSQEIEQKIRARFEREGVRIHVVGFAKMIGDLIAGIAAIFLFGLIALAITLVLLFAYTRCLAATLAPVGCSIVAVIWQLGLLHALGYGLNAYSILMPFLVFAIGTSHGVQVVNAVGAETLAGRSRAEAAQWAFRGLCVAGMTALVSDAVGFLTLLYIDIGVIRELGIAAALGVGALVLTNLVLLPVLMSWLGICLRGRQRISARARRVPVLWRLLARAATPPFALLLLAVAAALFVLGVAGGRGLHIGDLDPGAPELRADSRYNQDSRFVADNYATSSDVLVVLVETPPEACFLHRNLERIDRFAWSMQNVPGVESAVSLAEVARLVMAGFNEGSLKWAALTRHQRELDLTFSMVPPQLVNRDCSLAPVALFLADHKAETLARVVAAVEDFAAANDDDGIRFALAAGNAGIEAATNQEIARAQTRIVVLVYVVVTALVLASFRSLAAVLCIMLPLALTSMLCNALMAALGIGVKVATLPVIALGVGVGVDYGIYIYNRLRMFLARGLPLAEAYLETLRSTGAAVGLTGMALAIGVATWAWSPIKFQADMGMLLTFMFVWNMLGAVLLLPALAFVLLRPRSGDSQAGGLSA